MIETYKITTGKYDARVTKHLFDIVPSSTTRGHHLKILKKRTNLDTRKYFFTNRIVDAWNNLPANVISAENVKSFENRLDKHWQNHPMIFDYELDQTKHQPETQTTFQKRHQVEPKIEGLTMSLLSEQT
jgi:hypothetical protein